MRPKYAPLDKLVVGLLPSDTPGFSRGKTFFIKSLFLFKTMMLHVLKIRTEHQKISVEDIGPVLCTVNNWLTQ